jgi:hypothetical protein
MSKPMMKCGHAANGKDEYGHPVCVVCIGIVKGAETIDMNPPDLTNRTARCSDCDRTRPSSTDLAFFRYRGNRETDSFYCGCRGWD